MVSIHAKKLVIRSIIRMTNLNINKKKQFLPKNDIGYAFLYIFSTGIDDDIITSKLYVRND